MNNDASFFIQFDKLIKFLNDSSYALIWTSLREKRIIASAFEKWDLPPKAIHESSVYYLKDGRVIKASILVNEDRLFN